MHLTQRISGLTSQILSTRPGSVISSYSKNLWHYEPDSWVARIAYSARMIAILVSLPVAILGLLDIASYGIARTLGVVDDAKSSKGHKHKVIPKSTTRTVPVIHINGQSTPASYTDSERESPTADRPFLRKQRRAQSSLLTASQPEVFYVSGDNSLKLAGADIFSPAVSRPPSPTMSRKTEHSGESRTEDERDGRWLGLRQRLPRLSG